jgi:flagellar protein FliS
MTNTMLPAYARSQYEEMQVQTTPGKLVVMLYDGALRFLQLGAEALRRRDLEQQGLYLGKVQNILAELVSALDLEVGDLAYDLLSLYHYCQRRLLIGNATDDPGCVEEVIRLLSDLRDAWDQAAGTVHGSGVAAFNRDAQDGQDGRGELFPSHPVHPGPVPCLNSESHGSR